jgi:hypothetical protein
VQRIIVVGEHIAAGDAAVKEAKEAIVRGDMSVAWAAHEKAVAEYTLGNAGKKLVEVADLSVQIAAAEARGPNH